MKLTDASIIVLDTETTGVDTEKDAICEVGWSRVRHDDAFVCGVGRSQLINPERPIPAVSSAVHHITDYMVETAPYIEDWDKQLKADLMVAHNAPFDRAFCVRQGLIDEETPWLCTYRLARHLLPEAPAYGNQVLRYYLGFFDVAGDAHSAGHDAEVTAMILCRMLNEAKVDFTIESVIELSEAPVFLTGKAGFGKYSDKTWREIQYLDRSYLQWMVKQGPESEANQDGWDRDVWFTINELLAGRRHEDSSNFA